MYRKKKKIIQNPTLHPSCNDYCFRTTVILYNYSCDISFAPKEFVCDKLASPDSLYVESVKGCEPPDEPSPSPSPPSRLRAPSRPLPLLPAESGVIGWKWQPVSVCHYSCMMPGVGLKLVEAQTCKNCEPLISIKVCRPQKDVSVPKLGCRVAIFPGIMKVFKFFMRPAGTKTTNISFFNGI